MDGCSPDERFHVSIHDVEPTRSYAVHSLLEALAPRIGTRLSLGVVPCWHGRRLTKHDLRLVEAAQLADEVLLHGWTHDHGRGGLISLVTGGADEFSALQRDEARQRLRDGRALIAEVLGRPPRGFLAPAYQRGPIDLRLLRDVGLEFAVGWRVLQHVDGRRIPLATSIWDVSPVRWLSRLGELGGRAAELRRRALPVVAIHPVDIERGHLPHILATVDRLLAESRSPMTLVHGLLPSAVA